VKWWISWRGISARGTYIVQFCLDAPWFRLEIKIFPIFFGLSEGTLVFEDLVIVAFCSISTCLSCCVSQIINQIFFFMDSNLTMKLETMSASVTRMAIPYVGSLTDRTLSRLYYGGSESQRNFIFISLYCTHVTKSFGPWGPFSGEHYRFWQRIRYLGWLYILSLVIVYNDRLCGLVIRVLGYRSGSPGSIPGTTRKKSSGSRTGSTQPSEYNWGATW
jgi:hypothetical protein